MKCAFQMTLVGIALLSASACSSLPGCKVQRFGWVTGLKAEKATYYKDLHAHPRPAVNRMIKECHIQNFSIYAKEIEGKEYLFAYLEYTGKDFAADMQKMASDPATQAWWKETDPCQSALPDAKAKGKIWADAQVVYHLD